MGALCGGKVVHTVLKANLNDPCWRENFYLQSGVLTGLSLDSSIPFPKEVIDFIECAEVTDDEPPRYGVVWRLLAFDYIASQSFRAHCSRQ